MDRLGILEHIHVVNEYDEVEQLICKLLLHGAPTFTGIKPSSLVVVKNTSSVQLKTVWDEYRHMIEAQTGMDFFVLKETSDMACVLIYNKGWMSDILSDSKNSEFLSTCGYGKHITVTRGLKILRWHYECYYTRACGN